MVENEHIGCDEKARANEPAGASSEGPARDSRPSPETRERLASLATMVSGVVHEINNPLAYVLAGLEIVVDRELAAARREVGDGPGADRLCAIEEVLVTVRQGVERVREIVRDLRTFAGKPAADRDECAPTFVDVRRVLDAALVLAADEIGKNADVVKRWDAVPLISAVEAKLGQVFLNVLLDAAQACHGLERRCEIRVDVSMIESATKIAIVISDNGRGMDEATRARIFDPFFTTRPHGERIGLGLSIAHGIVSSLGGAIEVESTLGMGTTFRIVLLATDVSSIVPAEIPKKSAPAPSSKRDSKSAGAEKKGRVLIVDDEPSVARALRRMLEAYEVVVVDGGAAALALLEKDAHFDAVVCDMTMPDVSGMDVYETLLTRAPELAARMIFVTGGAFTARARTFIETNDVPLLDKPCEASKLLAAVAARL